jgi:hypothetical protein
MANAIGRNRVLSNVAIVLLLTLCAVGQEIGTVTLINGPLRLIRGATVLQGVEGVRLHVDDIVESSGFAQMELSGGEIVALGGPSRVLLLRFSHAGSRSAGGSSAELVLLSGWLKSERGPHAGNYRFDSPLIAAAVSDGTVVMHSAAQESEVFVESGSARVAEVSQGGVWRDPQLVKSGQFCSRSAGKQVVTSSRPSSSFVASMPREFRDTLPPIASHFNGKPPEPKRDHEVSYSDVQAWLSTSQAWRRGFVKRFQNRLSDPAFRNALEAHLEDYPEWDPVLHPERYQSKAAQRTGNGTDKGNTN